MVFGPIFGSFWSVFFRALAELFKLLAGAF